MNKEKIKSKFFYFFSLSSMCVIIVFIAYAFFLRTIEIDVMKGASFVYTGENGNAKVKVVNTSNDLNQRTQEFLSTVTYEVSPSKNLSNGDMIHVVASYDETLAEQYHFKAIRTESDIEVYGLKNRYNSLEEMDEEYLNSIYKAQEVYITNHAKEIFELNEINENNYELRDTKLVYRAFLQSKSTQSDRVIAIYKLSYGFEDQVLDIYYLVSIPDINDGNKVRRQDTFGEKAYLTEQEKLDGSYSNYVNRIYNSQFTITTIELEKEEELEEVDEEAEEISEENVEEREL